MNICIVGFGEAGQAIAQGLLADNAGLALSCFDIKSDNPTTADAIDEAAKAIGVRNDQSLSDALKGSRVVRLPHLHHSRIAAAGQHRARHVPLTSPRIGFQFLGRLNFEFVVVDTGSGRRPSSGTFALATNAI